jgi:hypothetical protein
MVAKGEEGFRVLALATRRVFAKPFYDREDERDMVFRGVRNIPQWSSLSTTIDAAAIPMSAGCRASSVSSRPAAAAGACTTPNTPGVSIAIKITCTHGDRIELADGPGGRGLTSSRRISPMW